MKRIYSYKEILENCNTGELKEGEVFISQDLKEIFKIVEEEQYKFVLIDEIGYKQCACYYGKDITEIYTKDYLNDCIFLKQEGDYKEKFGIE